MQHFMIHISLEHNCTCTHWLVNSVTFHICFVFFCFCLLLSPLPLPAASLGVPPLIVKAVTHHSDVWSGASPPHFKSLCLRYSGGASDSAPNATLEWVALISQFFCISLLLMVKFSLSLVKILCCKPSLLLL